MNRICITIVLKFSKIHETTYKMSLGIQNIMTLLTYPIILQTSTNKYLLLPRDTLNS